MAIGCASHSTPTDIEQGHYSSGELAQLEEQNAVINTLEQFVHSNLYTGMIQVWSYDRRPWNQLLNVHACNPQNADELLEASYQTNQPLFSQVMMSLAQNNNELTEEEQLILRDVSELAYRLFSASYGQGYARQVALADNIEPGIREALCGSQIDDKDLLRPDYSQGINWQSTAIPIAQQTLEPHANHGYKAFTTLLANQYAQFDALVYSHAYQKSDAYQSLFFEVNKYENVQAYGERVNQLSQQKPLSSIFVGHNDFAYLVLSSGYHWGMMSVLAMLEEEFPEVHDVKKQHADEQIDASVKQLQPGN